MKIMKKNPGIATIKDPSLSCMSIVSYKDNSDANLASKFSAYNSLVREKKSV